MDNKPEGELPFKPLNDQRFTHNELADILDVKSGTIRGEATECRNKGKQYRGYFPDPVNKAKWFEVDPHRG